MYGLGCADCGGECGLGISLSNPTGYTPWGTGPNVFGVQSPVKTPAPAPAPTPVPVKPLITLAPILPSMPVLKLPATVISTPSPSAPAVPTSAAPSVSLVPTMTVGPAVGHPSPVLLPAQETYGDATEPDRASGLSPWLIVAAVAALAFLGQSKR